MFGEAVEFVNHPKQEFPVLTGRCDGPEHVILIFTAVRSQAGYIPFKAHEQIELIRSPETVPWMVAFAFLSTGLKGKGKTRSTTKLEGQVGVCQPFEGMKMVDNKPHVLQIIGIDLHFLNPMLVTISGGSPSEITDHVERDACTIDGGGGQVLTIRCPFQIQ